VEYTPHPALKGLKKILTAGKNGPNRVNDNFKKFCEPWILF